MDRLISLEPSNVVPIRVEPGQKCCGELTLRNVMYTMPVAFCLQPLNRDRYAVRPQSGIIPPLSAITLEIAYLLPANSSLPESFPHSDDSFLLHSVVVPGAAAKKDAACSVDSVPLDWFTTKKKQVYTDSAVRVVFVGSAVLARLVSDDGSSLDELREVMERSDPEWRAADSVDLSSGQTLLHLAVARGRADLVQMLLEFEPDVEAQSRSGRTPLEAAAAAGEALIVELLLARGASNARTPASSLGPIHLAAAAGHAEVLRLLLLKGADADELAADGRTALHLAVEERRRECAEQLISAGCRTDVQGWPDGDTPLHEAAAVGDKQMANLLLHKGGACKDVRNAGGQTAYDVAAKRGHVRLLDVLGLGNRLCGEARKGDAKALRRLVEGGAAVDGRDQHGWTALMRAGFKGRVEAVRTLLEMGAAADARDEEGYTALHCAAEAGQAEAVELLVKRGADLKAMTAKGATATQIADWHGYAGIVRILAQGGTSTTAASATEGGAGVATATTVGAIAAAATVSEKLGKFGVAARGRETSEWKKKKSGGNNKGKKGSTTATRRLLRKGSGGGGGVLERAVLRAVMC